MSYDRNTDKSEAIAAAEQALQCLQSAAKELESARKWGWLDVLPFGFISTWIKRSKMNKAHKDLYWAKKHLSEFGKDIPDVKAMNDLNISLDSELSFTDYVSSDWRVAAEVQDRIEKSLKQVNLSIWRVERMLEQLKAEK